MQLDALCPTPYLVNEGETKDDLAKGPVNDFVRKWANKHLKLAGHPKELQNFGDDLKDGEIYTVLLHNLHPEDCDKTPLEESDPTQRMQKVLNNAKKIFIKLNYFVPILFTNYCLEIFIFCRQNQSKTTS